jgi:hypothetical protein
VPASRQTADTAIAVLRPVEVEVDNEDTLLRVAFSQMVLLSGRLVAEVLTARGRGRQ